MAVYNPSQVNVKPPAGGFQQGGWYSGRQYWGGTLSDPGVEHPSSGKATSGQRVSAEVNAQSAALQDVSSQQLEAYLQQQRQVQVSGGGGSGAGAGTPGGSSYTPRTFSPEEQTMMDQARGQFKQPSINLPEMFQSLYRDSGIESLKADMSARDKSYNDAVSQINDNPYYSEATRVGRLEKLDQKHQRDTQSLKNDIATKTADIETQMNIQTKQFDIDSTQAKEARDNFNTLLQLGALDSATGEDIAAIVRTTGISSSMILSAINANKEKNVQTSTVSFDDGTNQGFAVINSKTGEIISRQVVAASKPSAAEEKAALGGGESGGGSASLSPTQQRAVTTKARSAVAAQDSNKDKRLSQAEYTAAVQKIMMDSGVDFGTADNYATQAFSDLGYAKWRW